MKFVKGLLLIISVSLAVTAVAKTNPTPQEKIKDNIFTAIRSVDYVSINVLLSDGADIDTVNRHGETPLMVAAEVGNLRILDIILSHDPNVNMQNKKGVTALMIAAQTGQLQVIKKLVSHGADILARDEKGNTALTLASKFGHLQIVGYLNQLRTQALLAE